MWPRGRALVTRNGSAPLYQTSSTSVEYSKVALESMSLWCISGCSRTQLTSNTRLHHCSPPYGIKSGVLRPIIHSIVARKHRRWTVYFITSSRDTVSRAHALSSKAHRIPAIQQRYPPVPDARPVSPSPCPRVFQVPIFVRLVGSWPYIRVRPERDICLGQGLGHTMR